MAGKVFKARGVCLQLGHKESLHPILFLNTILLWIFALLLWLADDLTVANAYKSLITISPYPYVWAGAITTMAAISTVARLISFVSLFGGSLFLLWWTFFAVTYIINIPLAIGGYMTLAWAIVYGTNWVILARHKRFPELRQDDPSY